MGDVGEGAGVHEGRPALERLQQVGLDGVEQQHGHGPGHAQVLGRDRLARAVGGDHDAPEALAQVVHVGGQGQDGHDLAGHGDVELALAGHAR